ncbi:MAG: serine hydrolase [Nitrosospira multiformis]|jgi:CubicO group peptidase (beta-lactamase class C family)|nr:serine hydrolase [Nitrosospira multiformis]
MLHALVQSSKVISQAGKAIALPWWSFTKTVIATAALVLVRDKLLALDQTLENQPFTLRQLLRHEAGLADDGQLPDYHLAVEGGDTAWSDEEMLERTEAKRLRYLPGSSWVYSNIGYLYVRRLIEHRTGEDLEAALQRLVLRPLELNHVRLAKSHQDLIDVEMGLANTYLTIRAGSIMDCWWVLFRRLHYYWTGLWPVPYFPRICQVTCLSGAPLGDPLPVDHGYRRDMDWASWWVQLRTKHPSPGIPEAAPIALSLSTATLLHRCPLVAPLFQRAAR